MEERLRRLFSHFSHFLVILFLLSLLSCCFPLPHSYMPQYKSISGISPAPPSKAYARRENIQEREYFYIHLGARERARREKAVQRMGAGGTRGVVKRLRIGSTDCVWDLPLAITRARTPAKTFPPGLFWFFRCLYGLQACIFIELFWFF